MVLPQASSEIAGSVAGLSIAVTGAGRGLGRVFALGLARAGARVAVAGRTPTDLQAVVAEIQSFRGEAVAIPFEARRDADCERITRAAVDAFGTLNGIVINHGVTHHAAALETTPDDFRRVVDVNLCSAFTCAIAAGRQLAQQGKGGAVVFISSTAGKLTYPELVAYAASKGGLDQLVRQLAFEWAPFGIRVNAIAPGWMTSHMRGVESEYEAEDFKGAVARSVPMGRRGFPEELLGSALLMLSPASSYMTGQIVTIDGGHSLP